MPEPARIMVTLVHGTWATNAAWTQPGSKLRDSLANVPGIDFDVFPWTGKNSTSARSIAAEELAGRLSRAIEANPTATHVVIGHSHGGNIALRSAEIAGIFDRIKLVCLATPFFHIKERNYGVWGLFGIGLLITSSLFVIWQWYFFPKFFPDWDQHAPGALVVGSPGILALLLVGHWIKDRAVKTAQGIRCTVPSLATLLILRCIGDEATAGISAGQIVSWVLNWCVRRFIWLMQIFVTALAFVFFVVQWIAEKIGILLVILLLVSFFVLVASPGGTPERLAEISTAGCGILLIGILFGLIMPIMGALAVIASAAVVIPIFFLIGVCGFASIGRLDAFLTSLLYDITVEPVPVGSWTVHQMVPGQIDGLNHSAIYDDPHSLQILCDWLSFVVDVEKARIEGENDVKRELAFDKAP